MERAWGNITLGATDTVHNNMGDDWSNFLANFTSGVKQAALTTAAQSKDVQDLLKDVSKAGAVAGAESIFVKLYLKAKENPVVTAGLAIVLIILLYAGTKAILSRKKLTTINA